MQRDTLVDFFRDLITIRGDFLVYDDGYRRRVHTRKSPRTVMRSRKKSTSVSRRTAAL